MNGRATSMNNNTYDKTLLPLFERFIDSCHAQGLFRNCTNCFHWQETKEYCQKYNQRPPAKVIVKGCSEYDEIPF